MAIALTDNEGTFDIVGSLNRSGKPRVAVAFRSGMIQVCLALDALDIRMICEELIVEVEKAEAMAKGAAEAKVRKAKRK